MKVRELIRELKQFPNDYKVAFESYDQDEEGTYRVHLVRCLEKDDDSKNMLIIK